MRLECNWISCIGMTLTMGLSAVSSMGQCDQAVLFGPDHDFARRGRKLIGKVMAE